MYTNDPCYAFYMKICERLVFATLFNTVLNSNNYIEFHFILASSYESKPFELFSWKFNCANLQVLRRREVLIYVRGIIKSGKGLNCVCTLLTWKREDTSHKFWKRDLLTAVPVTPKCKISVEKGQRQNGRQGIIRTDCDF